MTRDLLLKYEPLLLMTMAPMEILVAHGEKRSMLTNGPWLTAYIVVRSIKELEFRDSFQKPLP